MKFLGAYDRGHDVLEVRFTDGEADPATGQPRELSAYGWLSALTNHYDPSDYDPDTGHRRAGAQPRAMTAAERVTYYAALIAAAIPAASSTPRRID